MKRELLRIEGGAKKKRTFSLKNIHIQCYVGHFSGIIFLNANEKKLMSVILEGKDFFDEGRIFLFDRRIKEKEWKKTVRSHIAVVGREKKLYDYMTVGENIGLYVSESFILKRDRYYLHLSRCLEEKFGIQLNVAHKGDELGFCGRILVEVMQAYVRKQRLIVLYQLTNRLDDDGFEQLLRVVQKMKEEGYSFLMLDSFEEQILKYADDYYVVDDGRISGYYGVDTIQKFTFIQMNNRDVHEYYLKSGKTPKILTPEAALDEQIQLLEFRHVETGIVKDLSFTIQQGEFVVMRCRDDYVCRALTALLKGEEQPLRGMICLKGKSLPYHETWRMLENDIGIMEEQPLEQNLVADMTLMDNLCLCLGRKISGLWMGKQYQNSIEMMLRRFIEKRYFGEKIKDLPLQVAYRAVFCKWLLFAPRMLICVRPFAAVDIDSVRVIAKEMIQALLQRGVAVLVITSNIQEVEELEGRRVIVDKIET